MKRLFGIVIFFISLTPILTAQLNVSGAVMSAYVLRGTQFSTGIAAQGTMIYAYNNLEIGAAGTADLSGSFYENDLWVKYTLGPMYVQAMDFYYPLWGDGRFTNFKSKNLGSHYLEIGVGAQSFVNIYAAAVVHNDTTYSPYLEFSRSIDFEDIHANMFFGMTYGKTFFYFTDTNGYHPVYYGVSASKNAVTITYYVNPYVDRNGIIIQYNF